MLAEKALAHASSNEQYSRRNNIKILGLKLEENENCRLAACKLITNTLGIALKDGDVAVAHILPRRINRSDDQGVADERPDPIIVRFSSAGRDCRDEVIKRRRQLKGTGKVIYEDLTEMNAKLLKSVKENPGIKNAWSNKGRIIGLTNTGKTVRFKPFEDIALKLSTA